jgi:hypothetical protein
MKIKILALIFILCGINITNIYSDDSEKLTIIINQIVNEEEWGVNSTEILDIKDNNYLVKFNYNQWQSTGYLIDISNEKYYCLKNEPGHIISLKFRYIPYLNLEIIEMVESTNMGNGYIHLFDMGLNEMLNIYYYDAHDDRIGWYVFDNYKKLKHIEYTDGTYLNIHFRDNYSLNIDYNYKNKNVVRIYGYRDYVIFDDEIENDRGNIILSQEINNFYNYNTGKNTFELIENISTGEYFDYWEYLNK